jgi:V/A-type H+-transporting ATPase subunit K
MRIAALSRYGVAHHDRQFSPRSWLQRAVYSLQAFNVAVFFVSSLLAVVAWLAVPATALAAQPGQAPAQDQYLAIGAALATGLAAIGAGIAVGIAGAAAIGAITEKPEVLGRVLIFVGLAEGIAIYGLIVSFMILAR